MKDWINQIYVGLSTGLTAGIVSAYLYSKLSGGMNLALIYETIILVISLATINYGLYWVVFQRKINKEENPKENVKKRKFYWKKFKEKLIEPEDNHLFGEIFIIVGAFLITKWLESIIPPFNGSEWLFFGIGFLFILVGVKLLRKNEQENKKS